MNKTSLINKLKLKAYPLVSRYWIHATLVEGKLKNTNEIFRCLFVENNNLLVYMLPQTYAEAPDILKKWRIWIPMLKKVLHDYSKSIDMSVAVFPLEYHAGFEESATFKSRMFIHSFIDTSDGWEGVRKRLHASKRKFSNRMDKNPNFSCRASNDLKDFDFFYNEMHVPHIQKRFGDLSHLDSYDEMKDSFLKGLLLLTEEGDKPVTGSLCVIKNDTLFMRRGGVLHGDEEYLKRGASSADYYFALKYALEHGIPKVDLMASRPFFNDGVYKMKREWGAEIDPHHETTSYSWVFFSIPEYSKKVASLFEMNPLIILKEDKMYGLVGWSDESPPSTKDEKQLREKYFSPGLDGLILLQPHSENLIRFFPNQTCR